MPKSRLPLESYWDPNRDEPDVTYANKSAVIDGFDFDWVGRRIPQRTFQSTDTAHWLALEVALQALRDAGYGRETLPRRRTGVIVGNTLTGERSRSQNLRVRWPFVERVLRAAAANEGLGDESTDSLVASTREYYKSVFPQTNEDTLAGSLSNTIAGRICNYLDLNGGGYTVDGACASSLLAVATAANVLTGGEIDVALVGGVDVSLDPFELVGFAKVGALSPSRMSVYDRLANGFIPGEGCGFVVLKRLEDARADDDYVYAVLRGWGVSSDGAGGLTAPSVDGQALAIRRAYKRAGYTPGVLSFIEGHGTGTPAGDPVEIKAIAKAMESYRVDRSRACGLTSFKSIVGHTKAAAGIGGFIKACIAVNRRVVPPTAGCAEPNDAFAESAKSLYPLRRGRVEAPDETMRAGVSAMGFGGINSHVTVESGDPPAFRFQPSLSERKLLATAQETELIALSAESVESLVARASDIERLADGMSLAELPDLAVELNGSVNPDHLVRAAVVASEPDELLAALDTLQEQLAGTVPGDPALLSASAGKGRVWVGQGRDRPRIGLLFPGQGSQRLNMARRLVDRFDWAHRFVRRADRWMSELGLEPISQVFLKPTDRWLDPEPVDEWRSTLRRTEHAQPALCVASALWFKYLCRLGVSPHLVAGHSLGELSALHAAAGLDDETLVKTAAERGRIMSRCEERGAMANVSCSRAEAEELIGRVQGYCTVANLNAPKETVVSGDEDAVERVLQVARSLDIRAVRLDVAGAFHSSHFEEAASRLAMAESVPECSEPLQTAVVTGTDGQEHRTGVMLRDYLARQMCGTIDFVSVARLMSHRCDVLLEVGPGRALSSMIGRQVDDGTPPCFPVESRPGQDRDLHVAIGALYALGAPIRFDALNADRLVRPFVPAADRVFIGNPCELPLAGEAVASREHVVGGSVAATRASPGAPTPTPREYERFESGIVEKASVRSVVFRAVQRLTGFPADSLGLDMHLVDHLNLDSIKVVELVSDVGDRLGIPSEFDASEFADATLGVLIGALDEAQASKEQRTSGVRAVETPDATDSPSKGAPEVDDFVAEWVEAPAVDTDQRVLSGPAAVVTAQPSHPFVSALLHELEALGVPASVREPGAPSDDRGSIRHVFVVACDGLDYEYGTALEQTIDLLVNGVRVLPPERSGADGASTLTVVRARSDETSSSDPYDWSPDAFSAAIHLERKELFVRSVEFDARQADPRQMASLAVSEARSPARFSSVQYRTDLSRWARKVKRTDRQTYRPRSAQLGSDEVVVVTGGAKGVTAQCAFALARETGAMMVLVGSSPPPERSGDSTGATEIAQTLERFRAAGLRCHYRQCDLTRYEDVAAMLTEVREEFGSVDVVVHGAGLNRPRAVATPNQIEVLSEIAPKLLGGMHLLRALQQAPPKMFVAITSIIGVTGMPGNAWYAFANQALHRTLSSFKANHPSIQTLSVAYGLWDEVGMGAKLGSIERLQKRGVEAIPVVEGSDRFVTLLKNDCGVQQVIVTARLEGIDTWQPAGSVPTARRRFVETVTHLSSDSLVCRTRLELGRDAYLSDHVYEGSHLLPAVFGLEAMAQAAARLTGEQAFELPLRIEEIELTRPLVVPFRRGLEIEVRAVEERRGGESTSVRRVRTEIRSEQTGFERAHFSACFVLEAVLERPVPRTIPAPQPLAVRPHHDLYGSVLFQGSRFQRVRELYALSSARCVFSTVSSSEEEGWLLGDPYVRDTLLQSLQLCVVPDQCLPVRIDRWDLHGRLPPHGVHMVAASIDNKEGDTYIGTVDCRDERGLPIETLHGYQARALQTRADWPDAAKLAGLGASPRPAQTTPGDRVRQSEAWDGGRFYRDVPGYGRQGQTAFFCRFPLSAQDSSSVSGSLNATNYFRWAGKLREWGGMNTPGVYEGILEMLGSNDVMSATNECETRILRVPQRNDFIEGRYWMEYVNKGDAGNLFEWWRIPFPSGEPEMIAWTRMRISAVKAVSHGVIEGTDWPDFLYRFLKDMGDDAPEPERGPDLDLDLGRLLFAKTAGPLPGPLLEEQAFLTSQEDSNVVGNIYFANYGAWQGRVTDRFFHGACPRLFENRGAEGELHRAETSICQLRDAVPFDEIRVRMRLDELFERGARLDYDFHRVEGARETKVAAGRGLVVWSNVRPGCAPVPVEWPQQALEVMLARVDQWGQQRRRAG